ncbi:MAG: prohibitin family protein [Clostridia bacterium]|nr:prohibitin family protein [Clostridia bacterium]
MQLIFIILPLIIMLGAFAWCGWTFWSHYKANGKKGGALAKRNLIQIIGSLVLAVAMMFVLVFVPASIHQVNTGEIAVVKVWGEAKYTKTAGIHFDDWISKEYVMYDLKTQEITSDIGAYSLDAQTMQCQITIQYKIQGDKVIDINEKYGSLQVLDERLIAVAVEQAKVVLSSQSAMEIIENRGSLGARFQEALATKIEPYYVDVSLCVVTNIDFSDAFEKVVEDKMIAEQEKLKAEYEKEKAIIQAEQELEVAKLAAEAKLATAEGEANAMKAIAEAEGKAIKLKSIEVARMMGFEIIETEVLEDNVVIGVEYDIDFTGKTQAEIELISEYLKYLSYLETWDGKLPTVMTDTGASIIMPMPDESETSGGSGTSADENS